MRKISILNQLSEAGIVAVVRTKSVAEAEMVSQACVQGGVTSLEITYTLPEASDVIKTLKQKNDGRMLVGAGTVLDSQTARMAILSGADFVVSPAFDLETAKICNRYHIPYIPGCMTLTEMIRASEAGCDMIKLFPSRVYPPEFIKDIKAPIPDIEIMPTGGIGLHNVEEWISNGASVVGVGGKLTKGTAEEITETARQFSQKVSSAKQRVNHQEKGALL